MICPECGSESKVKDSRDNHRSTYRRRECLGCAHRWSTFEVIHTPGMDPYPMCGVKGCFKPKDPKSKWTMCTYHARKKDSDRRKTEAYRAKQRTREKLSRWKGARK